MICTFFSPEDHAAALESNNRHRLASCRALHVCVVGMGKAARIVAVRRVVEELQQDMGRVTRIASIQEGLNDWIGQIDKGKTRLPARQGAQFLLAQGLKGLCRCIEYLCKFGIYRDSFSYWFTNYQFGCL